MTHSYIELFSIDEFETIFNPYRLLALLMRNVSNCLTFRMKSLISKDKLLTEVNKEKWQESSKVRSFFHGEKQVEKQLKNNFIIKSKILIIFFLETVE